MAEDQAESDDLTDHYRNISGGNETKGAYDAMRQAIEIAEKLNERIKESEEYKTYTEAIRRLRQESELYARFNEFRRRNCELQFSEGDSNLYDEVFNLTKEYDTILQNSLVSDFMLAEQRLSVRMQEMYEVLTQGLELDYEYLEK